jgi:hypothetical protein
MSNEYTYTNPMLEHRFIERHLITLMIDELRAAGWLPYEFDDGEDQIPIEIRPFAPNAEIYTRVWELFTSVDDGYLFVRELSTSNASWIRLIGGNGVDVISDYTMNLDSIMQKVYLR